jgi:hypothetical protein
MAAGALDAIASDDAIAFEDAIALAVCAGAVDAVSLDLLPPPQAASEMTRSATRTLRYDTIGNLL